MPKWFASKYLVRLLIFSLLIGTIPVVTLGSLSFLRAKNSLQQKVNDSNMQLLQQTQVNVEQVLQLFENLMTQYITTPIIGQALQTPFSAKNFTFINELSSGLNKLQPFELGVQNVYLANLKYDWLLSNQGYVTLEDSGMKDLIQQYASADRGSFWKTMPPAPPASGGNAGGEVPQVAAPGVRLIKKLPINWSSSSGLIIGEIPGFKLEKMVANDAEERETVILDDQFQPLTQPFGRVLNSPGDLARVVEQIKQASDTPEGYLTMQDANHKTIGILFNQSQYNGWYYLSLISLSDITKDSRSIGWYTLYVSVGTFVLILLVAWIGSRRMYLPIHRVFSVAASDQAADERQSKDELQFIGEQIHKLRSSQTELLDQLSIHSKQLEAFFIRRLLHGEIRPNETRERWVQFAYDPTPGLFAVLTIQIDAFDRTRYCEQDMDLLMFAINNIASELIPAEHRLEPVMMVGSQVTICRGIGMTIPAFEEQVYAYAELVQSTVNQLLEIKISMGISRSYEDIDETSQAYKESLEALKYRVRFGELAILPFDNVLPDTRIVAAYPEWLEKELIDAVKMEERGKAKALLNEFIQKAIMDYPRYNDLQMVLTRLLIDLLREWQEARETASTLDPSGSSFQERLVQLRTAEEIEAWFYSDVIEPMMDSLHHKWETQNKKISERMLEMIHEEFASGLTLELCASRLNYHPNYIKTVFRKETGSNFSDYLSKYRLTVAKQWLVETDMKINEIAEKLQYQNSQNFIRYFRKMEDMTPGQYREKHR
ncbi:helix-turn-helix transcriptional regulator [Paenibacillus cremeus]|nr:AraC family transcriptional regulator [Paenibacillus cremeus]